MSAGVLSRPGPYIDIDLDRKSFKRMILVSIVLHAFVLATGLFIIKGEPKRVFITPVYTVEILPPAKVKPQKKIKKAAAKKPIARKKTRKKVSKKALAIPVEESVSIEDALKRIEEKVSEREAEEMVESRISRIQDEVAEERREVARIKKEIQEAVSVEARLAKKSERVTSDLFERKLNKYYNEVGSLIRSRWIYPGDADGLEVLFAIKIARSGKLLGVTKEKSSGSALFDESAMRALKKAAPFPPLPEEMTGDLLEVGIRFCPECQR